ncbi:hypothetical protein ACQ86N_11080 [Puia sp. P3]|uniref:hypothetical protein n=1 Tax=Puia sp. P3 TaxID=3423952 RepID=UPI003D66604C
MTVLLKGQELRAEFMVTDTRLQVFLPSPVAAAGGVVRLRIGYSFDIPEYGTDRMGRQPGAGWVDL